jgi:TonB family protein
MAHQDKDKIDFAWEQIGTPAIWGKKFAHTCRDHILHDKGILTITGFAPDETKDSIKNSISKVLQTPEQYLATAGIMFNLPAEPDIQGVVPSEPPMIEQPKPLLTFDPAFSEEARKRKYQGRVVVMFYVGTDGRAHRPSIPHPLGVGLDQQALNVLSLCRFQPASKDGKPMVAHLNMEISFNLY